MSIADAAKPQTWRISGTPAYSWFAKIVEMIAIWRGRACDRQTLRRLNDHCLHDIGLTRHEVMIESTKPFWRA